MRGITGFVVLTVSIAFIILYTSCNSNSANAEKEGEFYYYPKANVYYNVASKAYYYSIDSAKTWQQITDTLAASPALLGEKIVLHSADSIWKDNAKHRQLYSGVLYNVASPADSADGNVAKVSERKVARKKYNTRERSQEAEEPKKKKGLGKFLQKVFGKKKDK